MKSFVFLALAIALALSPSAWGQSQATEESTPVSIGDVEKVVKEAAKKAAEDAAARAKAIELQMSSAVDGVKEGLGDKIDGVAEKTANDFAELKNKIDQDKAARETERRATMRRNNILVVVAFIGFVAFVFWLRKKLGPKATERPVPQRGLELVSDQPLLKPSRKALMAHLEKGPVSYIFEVPNRGTTFDGMRFNCKAVRQSGVDPLVYVEDDPEPVTLSKVIDKVLKIAEARLAKAVA